MDGMTAGIVIGVGTPVVAGGIFGLFKVWKNSVTKDDVSKQIEQECLYVKDERAITEKLDRHEETIKETANAVGEVQKTQGVHTEVLRRIEANMLKRKPDDDGG